jgi:hypothetical protein
MSIIRERLGMLRTQIHSSPSLKAYADFAEQRMMLRAEAIVITIGVGIALCISAGVWAEKLSTLIGFLYPAYQTVVVMHAKTADKVAPLLIYWMVFAAFCLVEYVSAYILYWVPFYYTAKVLLLVLCMPKYAAATRMYVTVLKPSFLIIQRVVESPSAGESHPPQAPE